MNGLVLESAAWAAERILPAKLGRQARLFARRLRHAQLERALRNEQHLPPCPIDASTAWSLHRRFPKKDDYRYDRESKDKRARTRILQLAQHIDFDPVQTVIDVGGGDGRFALECSKHGKRAGIVDPTDWRDEDVRAAGIPIYGIDGAGVYGVDDGSADLVVSFNTMEHIARPANALREMIRITKPGGKIFTSFGPLYNSPFGLHAYRTFYAPYPQFLLDTSTLDQFIQANGIWDLGGERNEFQEVNRWSLSQYRRLWCDVQDRTRILYVREHRQDRFLWVVASYFSAFRGRSLTVEELITNQIDILFEVN